MTGAEPLFDVPAAKGQGKTRRGGAVYQGVCATIRWLESRQPPPNPDDPDPVASFRARRGGTLAQARSLAAAIDASSGDPARGIKPQGGMQVAAMHAELRELLDRLDPPETGQADRAWTEFLDEMGAPPRVNQD